MEYSFTDAEAQPRPVSADSSRDTAQETGRRSFPLGAVVIIQAIFFLAHWLIYHTINSFYSLTPSGSKALAAALLGLSVSFVVTSTLSFRFSNPFVSLLYKLSSIWLGVLNFLFWAACLSSVADLALHWAPASVQAARPWLAAAIFGMAVVAIIFGFINARVIRIQRVSVALPNLPQAWRGRQALMISDLHLGHVNGAGFARRIARLVKRLDPSILFIAGDLYDGTRVDPYRLATPLFEVEPPLGTFFSEGNHEDFGDPVAYCAALRRGGIKVLRNEQVEVDGVRIIGVPYADTTYPLRFRTFLDNLGLEPGRPSILLNHVPNRLPIVEQAGISLQLSGHTHGGQVFPFTWFTRRVFGRFTYGLQRYGNLQVLTSSGIGTWGPPMRVGSAAEAVLITFE